MQKPSGEFSTNESWNTVYPKDKTIELRKKYLGSSIQIFFANDPIKIVKGVGQYMYDENNVQYLDCINNVTHVGHGHPYIASACTQQMLLLNTNCRYLHDNIVQLAERITKTLPDSLEVCYFVNSGSEANDLAMRIARYYTRSKETLVLEHAYHGNLLSLTEISPYKLNKKNCEETLPSWAHVVPTPDRYRGKYRDNEYSIEELSHLYAEDVRNVCESLKKEGKSVGMFYLESLQSCGGQVIFPKLYWEKICGIIHSYGGVIIADEVQTGFGRVGEAFWAFQLNNSDIIPDIVTMGKPMGNGYPISAVVTTRKISEAFRRGPDYFNTFGGNPVACAVGLAVLDVIENEKLQDNAKKIGNYVLEKFLAMMENINLIGDVRGSGLFIGIDLVKSRETREPATKEAQLALQRLKERKIIMSSDGPYENILKFKPPMCFNQNDADYLVENLKIVLTEIQDEQL